MNIIDIGFGHLLDVDNIAVGRKNLIIDAGMCVDVVDVSRFPEYEIIGIEASANNFGELSKVVASRADSDRIRLFNMAFVGESSPSAMKLWEFSDRSYWQRSNVHDLYTRSRSGYRTYEIPTMKANGLLDGLDGVDYMKMDVELCEVDIILTLREENFAKIGQLSFEFHGSRLEREKVEEVLRRHFDVLERANDEIFAERTTAR